MTTASSSKAVKYDTESSHVVMGLHVPVVTWWKHRGLRKLYMMMPILMLCATVNGYDGSLLNGLQTMVPWEDCESFLISWKFDLTNLDFDNPSGSKLGLFTAIMNLGGFSALFFCKVPRSTLVKFKC
jgi:hypothetical protein